MAIFKAGRRAVRYVVRHGGSKYAHLRLKDKDHLEVILPQSSQVSARELLNKKRAWIERALLRLYGRKRVFDRNRLLVWGIPHRLKVVKATDNSVKMKDGTVVVGLNGEINLRQTVKNWMAAKTREYAKRRLRHYGKKLAFEAGSVGISDSRKWGHCTEDRRVFFNWQLAALPKELADYVVLHEASHLSEFNHGHHFRARLLSLCPDFRERDLSLRSVVPWLPELVGVRTALAVSTSESHQTRPRSGKMDHA